MMNQCDEHVDYQLTKKFTRVNLLLNTIIYKDPGLNSAIAIVKGDKGLTGKINKLTQHTNLPNGILLLRIATPIGNMVQLTYIINPAE